MSADASAALAKFLRMAAQKPTVMVRARERAKEGCWRLEFERRFSVGEWVEVKGTFGNEPGQLAKAIVVGPDRNRSQVMVKFVRFGVHDDKVTVCHIESIKKKGEW